MNASLLSVERLGMTFPIKAGVFQRTRGHVYAVSDVSFSIRRGTTLGIVGESGSGKSTVARCIVRLLEPTAGSVRFDGLDITHLRESELRRSVRRRIQMVFQDPFSSLNPRQSLRSIVEEPLRVHDGMGAEERASYVTDLIERVGLDPTRLDRKPHELSGGQRQRIAIARALALKPELVIADEPVSALDVSVQAQIVNLLEELQRELELTYVFISHDLSVVRHTSDVIAVMYLGRLMELAARDRLFGEYRHPYTQALMSAVPTVRQTGERRRSRVVLEGDVPDSSDPPGGCVFHTRCPIARDRCRTEVPQLRNLASSHEIACHFPLE